MEYRGSYDLFDPSGVRTYPLRVRSNKVEVGGFADVAALRQAPIQAPRAPWYRNGKPGQGADQSAGLAELARYVVECRREGKPVVVISGGHPIKNGQNPIVIDLIERDLVTLYATNVAATIHSFELALTGASSESVRDALPKGEFGMAFETGHYLNYALKVGYERGYGYGECVGRLYCDDAFRKETIDRVLAVHGDSDEYFKPYDGFEYVDSCTYAAAWRKGIPICVHASLGFDIIDQHASFDGLIKGALSGWDFLIFTSEMCRMTDGGVILNFGSAVMAPEVVLKAVSMAANVGHAPDGLWIADFDVRPFVFDDDTRDEDQYYYYLRDQKSLATRIPKVFGGVGFYFQGLHRDTMSALYQFIMHELGTV